MQATIKNLETLTMTELVEIANIEGIENAKFMTKKELLNALSGVTVATAMLKVASGKYVKKVEILGSLKGNKLYNEKNCGYIVEVVETAPTVETKTEVNPMELLTVKTLKKIAKLSGVKGYSKMTKAELIAAIPMVEKTEEVETVEVVETVETQKVTKNEKEYLIAMYNTGYGDSRDFEAIPYYDIDTASRHNENSLKGIAGSLVKKGLLVSKYDDELAFTPEGLALAEVLDGQENQTVETEETPEVVETPAEETTGYVIALKDRDNVVTTIDNVDQLIKIQDALYEEVREHELSLHIMNLYDNGLYFIHDFIENWEPGDNPRLRVIIVKNYYVLIEMDH